MAPAGGRCWRWVCTSSPHSECPTSTGGSVNLPPPGRRRRCSRGFGARSGRCLVVAAQRQGMYIVATVGQPVSEQLSAPLAVPGAVHERSGRAVCALRAVTARARRRAIRRCGLEPQASEPFGRHRERPHREPTAAQTNGFDPVRRGHDAAVTVVDGDAVSELVDAELLVQRYPGGVSDRGAAAERSGDRAAGESAVGRGVRCPVSRACPRSRGSVAGPHAPWERA